MSVEQMRPGISYRNRAETPAQLTREVDELQYDVAQISEVVDGWKTVTRLVNKWGIAILTAAVTAGLVNGTTSEFLKAVIKAVQAS